MSYIKNTIKCRNCGYEMNVATGTFGSGLPEKCPNCPLNFGSSLNYDTIAFDWRANNSLNNGLPSQGVKQIELLTNYKKLMNNLKVGDIIKNKVNQTCEVRGVLDGNIVFSRILNDDGSKTMTTFDELEDLVTYGFTKYEIHKKYPRKKVVLNLLYEADDHLLRAFSSKNINENIIKAQDKLAKAMNLIEADKVEDM